MFGKIIILSLALLLEVTYAQQCLNISGGCVLGNCPTGEQCINDVCCTTDAAANCPNVLSDAFCDAHTAQCTDATLKGAMAKQCPRTCKACAGAASGTNSTTAAPGTVTTAPGGATCVDKVGPNGQSDCVKDAYLCNNAQYYDLMTQQCPKTCGRCPGSSSSGSGSPASSTCVDKVGPNGQSDCAKDAYLCNNAQYYDLMTQQCPKTCGRC
uniref:ShKT domain-containing protein n=1 Tax=Panagrolaimus sp. PS1159 TaxID=55785 RepID=A0AC35EWT5_9BILA